MFFIKRYVSLAALMLVLFGCTIAVQAAGSIVGFGGQIVGVDIDHDFVQIAASHMHSLGLKRDGSIVAWGDNRVGQCNIPTPNNGFTAIAAGYNHSLGLKADGSIVAWGYNSDGQCNVPAPNSGFTAIAAGFDYSLGLKADGSIVAWGANYRGQCNVPVPNSGFAAIAAGYSHSLGLKTDGSVVAWGDNYVGQSNLPVPNSGFTAIAAGDTHNLGLKADGSIVAWGNNGNGECNVPAPNSGFTAIAAGDGFSLGLQADGSIWAWGYDESDQCTVPAPNSGFTAIAAGGEHGLGLKTDGSIMPWGNNAWGQCNGPVPTSRFTAIAVGYNHSLGLKTDGSIVAWGHIGFDEITEPDSNYGFVAIAAGYKHSLGLRDYGWIVAWGDNFYYQSIVPAPNGSFSAIAAGYGHSLGLKADGSIVAWGDNHYNQRDVPAPNSGFTAIAAGSNHSLGLKTDGSIVAWGTNYYGQCTVPAPNSGFTAIAAGDLHSLGLKADGSVVAWGDNDNGQCNVPVPNSDFVAIAAGGDLSLGLKSDGSIVAWGNNSYGQCNIPAPNSGFEAIATDGTNVLAIRTQLPLTAVNLTGNPASPTATGMPVTLTATPTGGEAVEYQFLVKAPGATTASVLRGYNTTPTCPWTPTQTGTYALCVYAREVGSTAPLQVYKWIYYTVKSPLTAVNLTGNPVSPTATGTPVTLTATPSGGGTVEYQFLVKAPGATTSTILRGYSTTRTCPWTPTQVGSYALCVYAREVGSTATLQAYKWIYYTVKTPFTAVNLAGNPASPTATGMPVTLTATPTGGGTVEYQFLVKAPGATTSTTLRGYSTTPTYRWTPTQVGSYALCVYAREKGSTATLQAYKWITYIVKTPLTAVSLTGNPPSPITMGTPVTLTVTPTGGGTVEYQFLVKAPGATTSTVLRAYGTTRTCLWTPAVAGSYTLYVYAREVGSSVVYQAYKWNYYTVTNNPLLGSWTGAGSEGEPVLITFLDATRYILVQRLAGFGQGIEVGTYTWNPTTHAFTATPSIDTNGDWGLSNLVTETITVTVSGNSLNFQVSNGVNATFSRVPSNATIPIIGSWYNDNTGSGKVHIVFLPSGEFYLTQTNGVDAGGYNGLEYGTYTWTQSTHVLTLSILTDTNGMWGLSHGGGIITAAVAGTTLTLTNTVDGQVEGVWSLDRVGL